MSNTRQPGYYWVKYDWKGNGQPKWCIAEWCMSKLGSGELYWHMPGFSTQDDNEFQEINEARILSPDETVSANVQRIPLFHVQLDEQHTIDPNNPHIENNGQ